MALKRTTNTHPLMGEKKSKRVGGRSDGIEVQDVSLDEAVTRADLGGSSKYSNANFED